MNEQTKKIGNWISAILLGDTRELIARIDERTIHMQEDIKDLKNKVYNDISPKLDILWDDRVAPNHSPRQLNAKGIAILNGSGIKEVVDAKRVELLALVRERKPQNAYDAERAILDVVKELPAREPAIIDSLKYGAFKTGAAIEELLLVGGIYLRNLILPDLGF